MYGAPAASVNMMGRACVREDLHCTYCPWRYTSCGCALAVPLCRVAVDSQHWQQATSLQRLSLRRRHALHASVRPSDDEISRTVSECVVASMIGVSRWFLKTEALAPDTIMTSYQQQASSTVRGDTPHGLHLLEKLTPLLPDVTRGSLRLRTPPLGSCRVRSTG